MQENPVRVPIQPHLIREADHAAASEPAPIAERYVVTLGALLCIERVPRSLTAGGCYQLLSARHGAFRVMAAGERRATLCTAAIIPPDARYSVECCSSTMGRLFVDADSHAGRRLRDELAAATGSGPAPWIAVGERLIDSSFWNIADPTTCAAAIRRMLANIDRTSRSLADADPRIRQAAQLGVTLRAFTRWSRLHHYARLRAEGANLAAAARHSGFPTRRLLLQTMQRHFGLGKADLASGARWTSAS